MNKLLAFAALIEAATGVGLMIAPSAFAQLLLGAALSGIAVPVGRVAGIGLFSLGLACWPDKGPLRSEARALLTYNLLVTLYLFYLGIRGEWVGALLWPAAVLHAILTVLLARAWLQARYVADDGKKAGT